MRYEFWLGLRYLFARRRERFISISAALSISGVALGVTALVTVLSVMTGFDQDIKEKLIGINAHLIVDKPDGIEDVQALMRTIASMDRVVGVAPFVVGQVLLELPDRRMGVLMRGLDPQREPQVSRMREYLVRGAWPTQTREALIGTELSAFLGRDVGETVEIRSPVDGEDYTLTIRGVFHSGMYETDAYLLAVTLPQAQEIYGLEDRVHGVGVRLDELEMAFSIQRKMQRDLGSLYAVRSWMDLNPALFGALRVEKRMMTIIVALVVLVAAMNIMSLLTMIVMEKTKEIGILRALGATRGSVALLFLIQGTLVGLIGVGLGVLGGVALTLRLNDLMRWLEATFGWSLFPSSVYYLDYIPTQINIADVSIIVIAAVFLAILASTYSAIRAALLAPVEALRYE